MIFLKSVFVAIIKTKYILITMSRKKREENYDGGHDVEQKKKAKCKRKKTAKRKIN